MKNPRKIIKLLLILFVTGFVLNNLYLASFSELLDSVANTSFSLIVLLCLVIDGLLLPTRLYLNAKSQNKENRKTGVTEKKNYYSQYAKTSLLTYTPIGSVGVDIARVIIFSSDLFAKLSKKRKSMVVMVDKITGLIGILFCCCLIFGYRSYPEMLFAVAVALTISTVSYIKIIKEYSAQVFISMIGLGINIIIYHQVIHGSINTEMTLIDVAYIVPLVVLSAGIPINAIVGIKELTGYIYFTSLGAEKSLSITLVLIIFPLLPIPVSLVISS